MSHLHDLIVSGTLGTNSGFLESSLTEKQKLVFLLNPISVDFSYVVKPFED